MDSSFDASSTGFDGGVLVDYIVHQYPSSIYFIDSEMMKGKVAFVAFWTQNVNPEKALLNF